MNQEQRDALYGPAASFSEHKEGDEIQFRHGNEIKQGKILHVRAPGPAIKDGKEHSLLYMVDCNEGFPVAVKPSVIIQGSFTACIGTYGYPDSQLGYDQAENLVWHLDSRGSYIIDTDKGRLRVLKARVEGDEMAGKVVAECEAVLPEERH